MAPRSGRTLARTYTGCRLCRPRARDDQPYRQGSGTQQRNLEWCGARTQLELVRSVERQSLHCCAAGIDTNVDRNQQLGAPVASAQQGILEDPISLADNTGTLTPDGVVSIIGAITTDGTPGPVGPPTSSHGRIASVVMRSASSRCYSACSFSLCTLAHRR